MKSAFSTLLRFAFTFYIFLKEHMLAIEYGVCKLPYPVAEYQEARFPRQSEVELYVAMTVNVVVNVFVRAHILFRVTHEVLPCLLPYRELPFRPHVSAGFSLPSSNLTAFPTKDGKS